MPVPEERLLQDYRSAYNDIREWLRREKTDPSPDKPEMNWDDVVFEIDLLKSQEIDLDYILELIFEKYQHGQNRAEVLEEIQRVVRANASNRAKEGLIVKFIQESDLDAIPDKASMIDSFFSFAQVEQKEEAAELIAVEALTPEPAKKYLMDSLKKEYASENGTDLKNIMPPMSPMHKDFLKTKRSIFQKISAFVEKFKGVGGTL